MQGIVKRTSEPEFPLDGTSLFPDWCRVLAQLLKFLPAGAKLLPDGSGHFWTPVGVRIHVQSGLRILAALAIAACAAVLTRKKGGHAAAIRSVQPERIPLAEKRCQQAHDPRQKQDKQQNGADRQK